MLKAKNGDQLYEFYPFTERSFLDFSKLKAFADDNFTFDESDGDYSKGCKTLWEKEKLLVTSNFPFFYSVCKRYVLQAISPFPTLFAKDIYFRHLKTRACLGKG